MKAYIVQLVYGSHEHASRIDSIWVDDPETALVRARAVAAGGQTAADLVQVIEVPDGQPDVIAQEIAIFGVEV